MENAFMSSKLILQSSFRWNSLSQS